MSDTLTLKFPALERYVQSSRLEVSFARISTDELCVNISATVGTFRNSTGPLEFTTRTLCYGYDLAEFARELEPLHNVESGSDQSNDLDDIVEQHYDSTRSLPSDLRQLIDSLIELTIERSDPDAALNGGPAAPVDNSNAPGGPPSVS